MALTSDHEFAPSEVAAAEFPTVLRGYDKEAVRAYLERLSAAMRQHRMEGELDLVDGDRTGTGRAAELETEVESLRAEIRDLELELVQRSVVGSSAAGTADGETGQPGEFDEHRAIELLGQETARVLESARSAAADIVRRAEAKASATEHQAKAELEQAHARAEALVAQGRAETDELLARAEAEAEVAARRITADAEEHRRLAVDESTRIIAEAESTAADAEQGAELRARQVVADAEALRQQVIAELVSERRATRAEIDRLASTRDRLAMALAVARSELDELDEELAAVVVPPRRRTATGSEPAGPADAGQDGDPEPSATEIARIVAELDRSAGDRASSSPAAATGDDPQVVESDLDLDLDLDVDLDHGPSLDAGTGDRPDTDTVTPDTDTDTPDTDAEAEDDAPDADADAGDDEVDAAGGEAAAGGDDVEVQVISVPDGGTDAQTDQASDHPADGPGAGLDGFATIELDDDGLAGDEIDLTERTNGTGRGSSPVRSEPGRRTAVAAAPDEVITTVASRTATPRAGRTRGDLMTDEPFEGRLPKEFAARDLALTRCGPNFRRQIRRALNDDQSDVLDRLRAGRGEITVDELPELDEQLDRYLVPLRRGLTEVAEAGAKAGRHHTLSSTAVDTLVRQLARYIVDKVRIPTAQVIEVDTDHDRERILEPIRALYRDFRNGGLPDLAEDALYEAYAIGLYDSIEEGEEVRWAVDPRSDPDPVCDINRDRAPAPRGEVFPSGHVRPLSLPGCRCLVLSAG